nr:hypothetical protein L204_00661 [Cryptococcus depauperatus CBS 7855]
MKRNRHSLSNNNAVLQPNDDAAEKAKRRKSAHFSPQAEKPAAPRKVTSALAVQQKRAKRLSAVEPSMPIVSMEVMNNNFEEWMKLATDNKITTNNTWNFALIDYFADLTLLRNGPDDQSINFQKASCTLDGCVKIWTSRVDSVATETGKLLSGLAGGEAEAQEEETESGEEEDGQAKVTRKTVRSEATLAKSFAPLQVKKFDLEFTVDPLFKKTSADFDEGGAMGLLMNHLGVDGKGRVVFDAGDAGGEDQDDESEDDVVEDEVELDKICEYLPPLEQLSEMLISSSLSSFKFTSDSSSVPDFSTLVGLRDTWNDDAEGQPPFSGDDDADEFQFPPMDNYAPDVGGTGVEHDFFANEDFGTLVPSLDSPSEFDGDMQSTQRFAGQGPNSLALVGPSEHLKPFDPRAQNGEMVVALGESGDGDGMFQYFDGDFGRNWAGSGHWKLRKVSRKDPTASSSTTTKTKSVKAPFTIDFSSPSATSAKELFAPGSRANLTLPSSKTKKKQNRREEWLLPDDMHFSSQQLLRLFLKPKFSLRMRRQDATGRMHVNGNGEVDEAFWARATAERISGVGGEVNGGELFFKSFDTGGKIANGNPDFDSAPAPFESQFFQDDDDYGPDDFPMAHLDANPLSLPGTNLIDGEAEDLWAATQGLEVRRAKPENVNFAKKAKRVDVKRLKDDIWSDLKLLVPPSPTSASSDEEVALTTPTAQVKTFNTVIQSLRSIYPAPKMSEISTSFCFICLLHLANEEGLKIETARTDGKEGIDSGFMGYATQEVLDRANSANFEPTARTGANGKADDVMQRNRDRVVGELEALRVYKDHTAGRAA